jgi:hypothetical protein
MLFTSAMLLYAVHELGNRRYPVQPSSDISATVLPLSSPAAASARNAGRFRLHPRLMSVRYKAFMQHDKSAIAYDKRSNSMSCAATNKAPTAMSSTVSGIGNDDASACVHERCHRSWTPSKSLTVSCVRCEIASVICIRV